MSLDEDVIPSEVSEADASLELAHCLEPMLALLDKDDQHILRSVDMEARSQADMAREPGVASSFVKSRIQRARAKLYARLTDCCTVATDARGKPYDFELRKGRPCSPCTSKDGGGETNTTVTTVSR